MADDAQADTVDEAIVVESDGDDTQPAAGSSASHTEQTDNQLMLSDKTGETDASMVAGCTEQNGGQCIQLLEDSGHELGNEDVDHKRVNECGSAADESKTIAAADAASTGAEVVDSDMAALVDGIGNDADRREEPAAAQVLHEPQQQPAAAAAAAADDDVADIVEPIGNIIPPPIAVLAPQGLGDVHQAMMQGGGPVGFQPYKHPNLFALRVIVCFGTES